MDRALRLLALLSLVAAVVFFVVEKTHPPLDDPNSGDTFPYYFLREPLFAQTSLLLAVAVGVVTVTVAAWRGQRAWMSILLVTLLVVANSVIVFIFSLSGAAFFAFFTALPFLSVDLLRLAVVPALLPLLALAYTWWPPRAPASEPILASPVSPVATTSTRSITTERTLRLLATLALLVDLSIIPFVAYVTANEPSLEPGAAGQRLLGLWLPMLGQTSYLLAFGVGVAALTDAVWRRQRAWVWGLLVTLLVVAYGYILFNYLYYSVAFGLFTVGHLDTLLKGLPAWLLQQYPFNVSLLDPPFTAAPEDGNLLKVVIIPALLALVVLVYTVRPQRRSSSSASSGETTLSQPPTTRQVEPLS
jgi:hypothetical protein